MDENFEDMPEEPDLGGIGGDEVGEDPFEMIDSLNSDSTPPPQLNQKQNILVGSLEKIRDAINRDYTEIQENLNNLQSGEMTPEEKIKQTQALQKDLDALERLLQAYDQKETQLENEGIKDEEVIQGAITEEFTAEVEGFSEDLGILAQETQGEIETETEDKNRGELAENIRDLQGHLTWGEKGTYYYYGVWFDTNRRMKRLANFEAKYQEEAKLLLQALADGVEAGDWEMVQSHIQSLEGGTVACVPIAIVTKIIEEQLPTLWKELPSALVSQLAKIIEEGGSHPIIWKAGEGDFTGELSADMTYRPARWRDKEKINEFWEEARDQSSSFGDLSAFLKEITSQNEQREERSLEGTEGDEPVSDIDGEDEAVEGEEDL